MTHRFYTFLFVIMIAGLTALPRAGKAQEPLPKVKLVNVNRIFYNGEHNAFTDLIRFNGKFYLTFRSCPDGHGISDKSSILILSSQDGNKWNEVYRFHVEGRDTRDPHFVIFKKKLFVYSGTWYAKKDAGTGAYNMNKQLGYAVYSRDGRNWTEPVMLEGTYGHYIWRAAALGEKAYLCGRRYRIFAETRDETIIESVMLESDDGLIWKKRALFQKKNGDETAFVFETDGKVTAVARRGRGNAELCISAWPYTEWQRTDLGRYIGGPLLTKWGARYVAGGRKQTKDSYVTSLYWLVNGQLHEFITFPSGGGDTSYPGFVALNQDEALVSYYSSHEKDKEGKRMTAIYLAKIKINE